MVNAIEIPERSSQRTVAYGISYPPESATPSDAVQKIEQRLQIGAAQRGEGCFGGGSLPAVSQDRVSDGMRAAIVQEVGAVGDTPQRRRPEFAAGRRSLHKSISQGGAHIM